MKRFQIITVKYNKDRLANLLMMYNVKLFGITDHILVMDDTPQGINIDPHAKVPDIKRIMDKADVKQQMKASQAELVTFQGSNLSKVKTYLDKNYVPKKKTSKSLSYKSRTQKAHFVLYRNGIISTSKDLLDIDLITNLVRVINGQKPLDIANAVK